MTLLKDDIILHLCIDLKRLCVSNVIELDSNLSHRAGDGPWLVMFYAPWCGYCRKLEPIYEKLPDHLSGDMIKVARLDATKFPETASMFEVRGYPTIKYIHGSTVYTHSGDRTLNHLIKFSKRANGPAVRPLASEGRFKEVIHEHKDDAFFMYVGPDISELKTHYTIIAEENKLKSFYYEGQFDIIPRNKRIFNLDGPTVLAFKDENVYKFEDNVSENPERNLSEILQLWIAKERLVAYPLLTEIDLYDLAETGKYVAIFAFNETEIEDPTNDNARIRNIGKELSLRRNHDLNKNVQFAHMTDIQGVSNIVMATILPPTILVTHPVNHTFYVIDRYWEPLNNTWDMQKIETFISDVLDGKVKMYGGNGFVPKMKRLSYDFVTGLIDFITTSPILAMFILGIPIAVVSFLCYVICCMDSSDEDEAPKHKKKKKVIKPPLFQAPLLSGDEIKAKSLIEKKTD